jgi:hypothetical protein
VIGALILMTCVLASIQIARLRWLNEKSSI